MFGMSIRKFIILSALIVSGCISHPETIAIDFDSGTEDYTPLVRKILAEHPAGEVTIRFGAGTFDFYPEQAAGSYLCVSNNDNGYKRCAFLLEEMRRVRIEGAGEKTQLRFHCAIVPFRVARCEQIVFEAFTIDCDASFIFEGLVVGNDPRTHSITLRPLDPERFEIRSGEPWFTGYDWASPFGENILFDPGTRSPYYQAEQYEHDQKKTLQAEWIGDSLVRLSGYSSRELPPVGSVYTDKGPHSTNRRYPGFSFYKSAGVEVRNVTLHDSGGMALIAENCRDVVCSQYRVEVPPQSGRMVSASADATHFVGCSGKIVLRACRFESMLDDATNIHGVYMTVVDRFSGNRFGASFGHFQQEGFDFAEQGDSLVFIDRADLGVLGCGRVEEVNHVNENYYIIRTGFDLSAIPDSVHIAVGNRAADADVEISECTVRYNRARSFLLSTPGDVCVENSDLSSMMAGIRICGDANYWFESGRTRNVVIRNNRFGTMATGGRSPQAVLQIDPVISHDARSGGTPYHGCIRFEGNLVESFDNQLIYALSVDSLVISRNRFVDSRRFEPRFAGLSVIDAQHCRSVTVWNNDFSGWKENSTISLVDCSEHCLEGEEMPRMVENPNPYFYEN